MARATSDYWQQQQQRLKDQAESRRVADGETEVSIPGLVGIDQEYAERQQRQKVQLREWLAQQQSEKAAEREQQKLDSESTGRLVGGRRKNPPRAVFQGSGVTRVASPWTGGSCSFTWPPWTPGERWPLPRKTSIC